MVHFIIFTSGPPPKFLHSNLNKGQTGSLQVRTGIESHLSFCLALFGSVCMLNWVRFLRSLSLRRFLCWNKCQKITYQACGTRLKWIHEFRVFGVVPEQTSCGSSGRPSSVSWRCPPAGSSSHPPHGSKHTDCHHQTEKNIYLKTKSMIGFLE